MLHLLRVEFLARHNSQTPWKTPRLPGYRSAFKMGSPRAYDLDTEAAASVLKTLQQRLENDHELELSLSWRLQRRSSQP